MEKLIGGLRRFVHTVQAEERELFANLASGQSPETLMIACSDSRVDPNLITMAKPGELFVIRNAGNVVPPYDSGVGGEAAAVEFAVNVLGVEHIVLCGHSGCGAMISLLQPETHAHLPAVTHWLQHAEPVLSIVERTAAGLTGDALLEKATEINVLVQLSNLRAHPAVASALERKAIELHGWVYDIPSGIVSAYTSSAEGFEPLNGPTADSSGPAPK